MTELSTHQPPTCHPAHPDFRVLKANALQSKVNEMKCGKSHICSGHQAFDYTKSLTGYFYFIFPSLKILWLSLQMLLPNEMN